MPQHEPLADLSIEELQEAIGRLCRCRRLFDQELAYRFSSEDRRQPNHARDLAFTSFELVEILSPIVGIDCLEPSLPIVDVRPLADLSLNTTTTGGT